MICRVTGCIASGADAISERRDIALRHPRSVVQEARGFVERLDVDLDDRGAEARQAASAAS